MRALALTWRGAWQGALADRRALASQLAVMTVNDAMWIVFWVVIFSRVDQIRGWEVIDVLMLNAIAITGGGFVLGFLSNARRIGELVADGELDAALSLPVPTLPHLLVRRVDPMFVIEPVSGILMFLVLGQPSPVRALIFVFAVVCAVSLFVGFFVLVGSLAFFLGRTQASQLGFQTLLLFVTYPADIFGPAMRLVLYVIIPAAFISTVPVGLLDDPDPAAMALSAAVATAFLVAGASLFRRGLRHYTRGSSWAR